MYIYKVFTSKVNDIMKSLSDVLIFFLMLSLLVIEYYFKFIYLHEL